jgi:hypothetical protein
MEELGAVGVLADLRPDAELIGKDGNAFNLVALVMRALQREGLREEAEELNRVYWNTESYSELLNLLDEYVNIM